MQRKINDYEKDKNLKDVCDFNKISEKVLEDKYKPKFKNYLNELTLNDIEKYKKYIEKNIKKNEKSRSGEYFRQHFNKIFNIKIFDTIDKNLNTKDPFQFKQTEKEVIGIFSVTLSFLWNISNDKDGIKEYYRGLSEHIYSEKIEKLLNGKYPEFYETFTKEDIIPLKNSQNFNHALYILDSKTKGSLTLQTTQNVNGFGDCAETSIKNFIKILIYDYDKDEFSLEKLEQIGAKKNDSQIYEFFRTFNKDYHHSSNTKTYIFGEELNVRQAWIEIMSNIPGVKYKGNGNKEIYPGLCTIKDRNNIEVILEYLFGVKTFIDLENRIPGLKFKIENPTNIIVKYKNKEYKWIGFGEHLDFKLMNSEDKINFDDIEKNIIGFNFQTNPLQRYILHTYNKNLISYKFKKGREEYFKIFEFFYYHNFNRNNLSDLINSFIINYEEDNKIIKSFVNNNELYNIVFEQVEKLLSNQQKSRIYINFSKLNEENLQSDFTIYGSYLKDNILKIKILGTNKYYIKLGNSISKLENLKKFKLYITNENFSIKDSFTNLKNLEEILFTAWYPKDILEILKLNERKFKKLKIGSVTINKYSNLKQDLSMILRKFPYLNIFEKNRLGEWKKYLG